MLYLLFLGVIAFREEELAYPWTYSAILGIVEAIVLKFLGHSWAYAAGGGFAVYLYLGITFLWLSRQSRFSLTWWLALFFASLPVTLPHLLGGVHGKG